MVVTVRVRTDVADSLRWRQTTADTKELMQAATELGVALTPIHPGAEDPHLAPYFSVEVPDHAAAERVIARLRNCHAVEGAYTKPPDALPGT